MDAIPASASSSNFDAALKALEDLETSVVQTREANPAPRVEPVAPLVLADAGDEASVAIVALPLDEIDEASSAASGQTPAPSPAVSAPVPVPAPASIAPPVIVAAPPGRLTKIAIGLGLMSSVMSAAGLLVANRSIASASLVVADARERQQQLEQAGRLIHDLEQVRDRQIELLQRQQAALASAPVTSEELRHRLETLQAGLSKRDPVNDLIQAIHEGQSESNERLNEFGMKMARVEMAVSGRR